MPYSQVPTQPSGDLCLGTHQGPFDRCQAMFVGQMTHCFSNSSHLFVTTIRPPTDSWF